MPTRVNAMLSPSTSKESVASGFYSDDGSVLSKEPLWDSDLRRNTSVESLDLSVTSSSSFQSASSTAHPTAITLRKRRRRGQRQSYFDTTTGDSDDGEDDNSKSGGQKHSALPSPRFLTGKRSKWLIPADHKYKILWDFCTILVSFFGAYHTHASIRDRSFGPSYTSLLVECWFFIDILLNFVTQVKTFDGHVVKNESSVWARYLTSWFVVDVISLIPWETLWVKPVIDLQNRRGFFRKSFFRTKAFVRVTRILRGRHIKLFGKVAKTTKRAGFFGARGLLRMIIRYVPKYLLFLRKMKGIVVVRLLRQVHHVRKFFKTMVPSSEIKHQGENDEDTSSTVSQDFLDDFEDVY